MRRTRRKTPSTRGFTLLEVLIAVLIVGIIATAVVPMVSDYAERARDAQIEANTKAVEMASQRYELVHKVPLGYAVDTSTDTLHDIFGDDGSGFWMQLVNPTDVNGNILGASLDPTANAFAYGPYLAPGSAKPASLLLGAGPPPSAGRLVSPGPEEVVVGHPTGNRLYRAMWEIVLIPDDRGGIAFTVRELGPGGQNLFNVGTNIDAIASIAAAAKIRNEMTVGNYPLVRQDRWAQVRHIGSTGERYAYHDTHLPLRMATLPEIERYLDLATPGNAAALKGPELPPQVRDIAHFFDGFPTFFTEHGPRIVALGHEILSGGTRTYAHLVQHKNAREMIK